MKILYQPVAETSDWYAPETLAWCAGTVVASYAIGRVLGLMLTRWKGSAPPEEVDAADFNSQQAKTAGEYPPVRLTASLFGHSLLLAALSLGGCYLLGDRTNDYQGSVLLVSTNAGLPAALALLLPIAALTVALSLVVVVISAYRGASVVSTGLFAVIWLFTLTFALVLAGLVTRASLPALGNALLAAAAVTMALGFWLRQGRLIGGKTTRQLAREKLKEAQRAHARRMRGESTPQGEYTDHTPRIRTMPNEGAELGTTVEIQPVRLVRRLRWDEAGVQVEWSDEQTRRFAWSELTELRYTSLGRRLEGVIVSTSSGDELRIPGSGKGYRRLTATLETQIWGREAPRGEE